MTLTVHRVRVLPDSPLRATVLARIVASADEVLPNSDAPVSAAAHAAWLRGRVHVRGEHQIAAEQTGRKALLMELDPLYCDVEVHRQEGQRAAAEEATA